MRKIILGMLVLTVGFTTACSIDTKDNTENKNLTTSSTQQTSIESVSEKTDSSSEETDAGVELEMIYVKNNQEISFAVINKSDETVNVGGQISLEREEDGTWISLEAKTESTADTQFSVDGGATYVKVYDLEDSYDKDELVEGYYRMTISKQITDYLYFDLYDVVDSPDRGTTSASVVGQRDGIIRERVYADGETSVVTNRILIQKKYEDGWKDLNGGLRKFPTDLLILNAGEWADVYLNMPKYFSEEDMTEGTYRLAASEKEFTLNQ